MNGIATSVLVAFVRAYRLLLSPWLGNSCRFEPTCSNFSLQALTKHGAIAGTALTVGRIARCHPWCAGGHDPVPSRLPRWLRPFSTFDGVDDNPTPAEPDRATP